jgi:hypothetical protein
MMAVALASLANAPADHFLMLVRNASAPRHLPSPSKCLAAQLPLQPSPAKPARACMHATPRSPPPRRAHLPPARGPPPQEQEQRRHDPGPSSRAFLAVLLAWPCMMLLAALVGPARRCAAVWHAHTRAGAHQPSRPTMRGLLVPAAH